ncbi:hypothetical protein [Caloranaerobacter azorensis]|uniref:Uncharacterized protein n=1 Tax=Caloranaerobacter azorensis TaxID=116090 RepID=A0A6P1YGV0_9FIRM|nr:hypothetical protein [Caloranaerobacter azorensis]QIB28003.1 hypothetical protein G3A45_12400 [Caloranaerobacter azorensis]
MKKTLKKVQTVLKPSLKFRVDLSVKKIIKYEINICRAKSKMNKLDEFCIYCYFIQKQNLLKILVLEVEMDLSKKSFLEKTK